MRLLLTTDTIGGVWTFTMELTTGLLDQGHCVALVSLGRLPFDGQRSWVLRVQEKYGEKFHYLASDAPLEWMENNEGAYHEAEPILLKLIEDFQPDVFHASQFCFGSLPSPVPKVITAHSDVLSWAEACRPLGLADSKWLTRYRVIVEAGLVAADAIVAPTAWMADTLQRHYGLGTSPTVILNGRTIDMPRQSISRRVQAVSVGRLWDEGKQISMLAEVHSSMPIFVAGERVLGEVCAVEQLGSAVLLGSLKEDEVLNLFCSSSLYVVTSLYEPFGLAPVEAALRGCGVVANDLPSLREIWGDCAMYFTDAASLSALLTQVQTFPEMLLKLRRRSLQRARQLSRERMTLDYVQLYKRLIAKLQDPPRTNQEVATYAC